MGDMGVIELFILLVFFVTWLSVLMPGMVPLARSTSKIAGAPATSQVQPVLRLRPCSWLGSHRRSW